LQFSRRRSTNFSATGHLGLSLRYLRPLSCRSNSRNRATMLCSWVSLRDSGNWSSSISTNNRGVSWLRSGWTDVLRCIFAWAL